MITTARLRTLERAAARSSAGRTDLAVTPPSITDANRAERLRILFEQESGALQVGHTSATSETLYRARRVRQLLSIADGRKRAALSQGSINP